MVALLGIALLNDSLSYDGKVVHILNTGLILQTAALTPEVGL